MHHVSDSNKFSVKKPITQIKLKKFLITGTAGFIGYHLATTLLLKGDQVVGIDNINDYYDISLKYDRLNNTGIAKEDIDWNILTQSRKFQNYRFMRMNLANKQNLQDLFNSEKFDYVIHFAAQAGVRYSIDNPDIYIQSNIIGFFNILEVCRQNNVSHLIYASSSSVYGNNPKAPFSEADNTDQPVSLYAATKKSNELMAYAYSQLYNIPCTGLRFFTVYGPWGRPDMAVHKFTKALLESNPIDVYNEGELYRDFTYIDDIIEGIMRILQNIYSSDIVLKNRIFNIGNNSPVKVMDFITILEKETKTSAVLNLLPMQAGDVLYTYADISSIQEITDYIPTTNLESGIKKFVKWYIDYYKM